MSVQSVNNNNKNKVNMPLVVTTAAAGAIGGGFFARHHLSEERFSALADLDLYSPKTVHDIVDCFDMSKAESEMNGGSLSKEEYDTFKKAQEKFIEAAKAEEEVLKVSNTPLKERKISISKIVRQANKARIDAAFRVTEFSKELALKVKDLKLINEEKIEKIAQMQLEKTKKAFKIISGPFALAACVGASLGVVLGLGLSGLFTSNKKN